MTVTRANGTTDFLTNGIDMQTLISFYVEIFICVFKDKMECER